jgi:uncharacterized membrane protein
MRHILTSFLAFHWVAIFTLLAAVSAFGAQGEVPSVFVELVGGSGGDRVFLPAAWGPAVFATGFCMVAVLFLWGFVAAFFGDGVVSQDTEEVERFAFGTAVGALTLWLLVRAGAPAAPLFTETAILVTALLASYLAVFAEHWSEPIATLPSREDIRNAARVLAAKAAYNSMLSRFFGRPYGNFGGNR